MDTLNRFGRPSTGTSVVFILRDEKPGGTGVEGHRTTHRGGVRSFAAGCFALVLSIVLWAAIGVSPLRADQKIFRVGVMVLSESTMKLPEMVGLAPALAKRGYEEGKNLQIEYRYGKGESLDVTESANELVQMKVDLIYARSAPMGRAAFAATKTIPH